MNKVMGRISVPCQDSNREPSNDQLDHGATMPCINNFKRLSGQINFWFDFSTRKSFFFFLTRKSLIKTVRPKFDKSSGEPLNNKEIFFHFIFFSWGDSGQATICIQSKGIKIMLEVKLQKGRKEGKETKNKQTKKN